MNVVTRLIQRLEACDISCELRHHTPVYTSEEAARVRGTSLASGAKALICKADDRFIMYVVPAERRWRAKWLCFSYTLGSAAMISRILCSYR